MSRFHKYSWGNVLLIFTQRPNASHVAGFQTWRRVNRFVRKGEKGIAIFAPMVVKKRDEAEQGEDEQTRLFGFRTAYVVDESQTDREPLPSFATVKGDLMEFTATLETLIEYTPEFCSPGAFLTHVTAALPDGIRSRCRKHQRSAHEAAGNA